MAEREGEPWGQWATHGIQRNIARLLMMGVGGATTVVALASYEHLSDSEYWATLAFAAVMMLIGYLAPSIKRLLISKSGVEVEMHDRTEQLESRAAATELTEEVATTGADIEPDEAVDAARFLAADVAIRGLLDPNNFGGAHLRVYLMDDRAGGLVPAFGALAGLADQKPWKPGVGVVGQAFTTASFTLAVGEDTSNEAFRLDTEQQGQHPDLPAVAATPILNSAGTVIGVLAASERNVEPPEAYIASDEGRGMLEVAADAIARILIDLVGLFADDV